MNKNPPCAVKGLSEATEDSMETLLAQLVGKFLGIIIGLAVGYWIISREIKKL